MSAPDSVARRRWFLIFLTHLAASAGALLGVVLLARAGDLPTRILGGAIVAASFYVMATVPRALARRWKSPGA